MIALQYLASRPLLQVTYDPILFKIAYTTSSHCIVWHGVMFELCMPALYQFIVMIKYHSQPVGRLLSRALQICCFVYVCPRFLRVARDLAPLKNNVQSLPFCLMQPLPPLPSCYLCSLPPPTFTRLASSTVYSSS
jgi:hypothetical protein